jgi:hypothetical protein
MRDTPTEYLARCHCGALTARYLTAVPIDAWSVRACQCSFCRAHAVLSTSDPEGSLAFYARDPAVVQRYGFGLCTADFLICRECGVYVGAVFASGGHRFGILNLRALQALPEALKEPIPMSYDNETMSERVARRSARWTPVLRESL